MNTSLDIKGGLIAGVLLVGVASLVLAGTKTNETYTVRVPALDGLTISNVFEITNHTADCTLVRYRDEHGKTNEFHAWLVSIVIETNRVGGKR